MRAFAFAVTLLIPSLIASPALAQQKKQAPPKAGAPAVRYVDLLDLLSDRTTEEFMKETRSGASVTSAVLDLCYSAASNSNRKDQLVVTLSPSGGKLAGTGQTQEQKLPADVQLVRKVSGKSLSYEGTIKIGPTEFQASSSADNDMSEDDFQKSQSPALEIVASPANFQELAPGALAVRVQREALVDVVKALED